MYLVLISFATISVSLPGARISGNPRFSSRGKCDPEMRIGLGIVGRETDLIAINTIKRDNLSLSFRREKWSNGYRV